MPHMTDSPQREAYDRDTAMTDIHPPPLGAGPSSPHPSQTPADEIHHHNTPLPTEFPVLQGLPAQRHQPLREGFQQASFARRFVDGCLVNIQQRNLRRLIDLLGTTTPQTNPQIAYTSFAQVCEDVDQIVNFLWYTGSPFLQIPYMFELIVEFVELAYAMDPAPIPTLIVLRKFDHIFASLARQKDVVTDEAVVGVDSYSMTQTDIVRLQAIVSDVRARMWEKLDKTAAAEKALKDGDETGGRDSDDYDDCEDDDDNDDDDLECSFGDRFTEAADEPLPGATDEQASTSVDGSDWRPPRTTTELGVAVAQVFEQTLIVVNEKLGDSI
ncbi:hypothetical protein CFIMG_006002RA [Ceratocystis fimbriata CBS 114723]|uniref:Uncharacterized protein n=1 Tax=Ceratocystis fimbriata CBS 114723 TaxID=1035309 RepID=A0A2C5WSI7_9PEZI|nr:hypothetical protein CFIMG_006002RA [Ceratocystis fimbriata CBS 114723]